MDRTSSGKLTYGKYERGRRRKDNEAGTGWKVGLNRESRCRQFSHKPDNVFIKLIVSLTYANLGVKLKLQRETPRLLDKEDTDKTCAKNVNVSLKLLMTFDLNFKIPPTSDLTALHRSLSKYLTAQDTRGTPTLTKHNRTLAMLGNLLYLRLS